MGGTETYTPQKLGTAIDLLILHIASISFSWMCHVTILVQSRSSGHAWGERWPCLIRWICKFFLEVQIVDDIRKNKINESYSPRPSEGPHQGGHGEVAGVHLLGEPVHLPPGVEEDDRLGDGQGLVQVAQRVQLPLLPTTARGKREGETGREKERRERRGSRFSWGVRFISQHALPSCLIRIVFYCHVS